MQLLRRPISVYDRIPDGLYVIGMEFLSLTRRRSSSRNVPAVRSEKKQLFWQAIFLPFRPLQVGY